jgi:biopolymer transport protein TolQ
MAVFVLPIDRFRFTILVMLKIKNLVFISALTITQNVLAASPPTSSNVGVNTSALNGILHASFIVQAVILILVSLSVLSWAIGWEKYNQFKSLKKLNTEFDNLFWSTSSLDALFEKVDNFSGSSHARVFKAAYVEMKKIAESPMSKNSLDGTELTQLSGLDNLERSLRKASENEISDMETRLTILASTGSTGPFIGLFGTVWGIMNSFQQIGITGSASLAAVAVIRKEEVSLNNFSTDFLNIVKRNFFKG